MLLMFGDIGMGEWVVILFLALLVFGPKRLPELSRKLGRGLRQFQHGWNEVKTELEKSARDDKTKPK